MRLSDGLLQNDLPIHMTASKTRNSYPFDPRSANSDPTASARYDEIFTFFTIKLTYFIIEP